MKAFIDTVMYLFHWYLRKTHCVSDIVENTEYINSEGKSEQSITQNQFLPIDHRHYKCQKILQCFFFH